MFVFVVFLHNFPHSWVLKQIMPERFFFNPRCPNTATFKLAFVHKTYAGTASCKHGPPFVLKAGFHGQAHARADRLKNKLYGSTLYSMRAYGGTIC